MAEPSTISEPSTPPSADEGLMDDGGEGAAGNADAVWVKFADGSVDELDREVRAQGGGEEQSGGSERALTCCNLHHTTGCAADTVHPRADFV